MHQGKTPWRDPFFCGLKVYQELKSIEDFQHNMGTVFYHGKVYTNGSRNSNTVGQSTQIIIKLQDELKTKVNEPMTTVNQTTCVYLDSQYKLSSESVCESGWIEIQRNNCGAPT